MQHNKTFGSRGGTSAAERGIHSQPGISANRAAGKPDQSVLRAAGYPTGHVTKIKIRVLCTNRRGISAVLLVEIPFEYLVYLIGYESLSRPHEYIAQPL